MTTVTAEAAPVAKREGNSYWRLWKQVPKELGFLVLTLPIAAVGYGVTVGMFSASAGTAVTVVFGIVFLIAALYVSRGFGIVELARLEWAGRAPIARPDWQQYRVKEGFWGWLRSVVGNGHYWLYLLHTMVINFIVSTITWTLMIVWVSVSLGGVTYWFWQIFLPQPDNNWAFSHWIADRPWIGGHVGAALAATLIYVVIGLVFLATLPYVLRGLTSLHELIARGLLGAFKSDALRRQVGELSASRGAAISAEGHSLRRLERDIHDGPQQRLVRLQMDLASAERQLAKDPVAARNLIAEAMNQSKEALEELRALSRGFAPPILLDRGLVAALESAAVRNTVPTRVVDELPVGIAVPQEIERNAYFVASEALANAAKYSGATDVEVRVATRHIPEARELWLDITITDNGKGGAKVLADHGISGLQERLHGLGGSLEIASPKGGPTVISAHLPFSASVAGGSAGAAQ